MIATASRSSAYSYGPDDHSPMRARLASAFDRLVDIRGHVPPRGGRAHPGGRSRHPDRPQGLYPSGAAGDRGPPAGAGAGQLSRLSRHHGGGLHRLHHGRSASWSRTGQQPFFSERLVHLPGSYQVERQPARDRDDRTSRQDWGLPAEGLVLCSFNNSYKISPAFFDIWMRLLRAVPGSVLWLLEANELVKGNLRSEAETSRRRSGTADLRADA